MTLDTRHWKLPQSVAMDGIYVWSVRTSGP